VANGAQGVKEKAVSEPVPGRAPGAPVALAQACAFLDIQREAATTGGLHTVWGDHSFTMDRTTSRSGGKLGNGT
jgi:hypothetical protein